MKGRAQRRRGEKEREEECIASSDTNQMTCSTEEDLRTISKCINELKQIIADDVGMAKATKTHVNQIMEEMMQLITQMNNEMQDERQKMQDEMQKMQNKLTKEEGRSAELQSAVHALKEDISGSLLNE